MAIAGSSVDIIKDFLQERNITSGTFKDVGGGTGHISQAIAYVSLAPASRWKSAFYSVERANLQLGLSRDVFRSAGCQSAHVCQSLKIPSSEPSLPL